MRPDTDISALRKRIEELECTQKKRDAELATARALLAATWPGNEIPAEPVPAELAHALCGPRQTVRLIVDGQPVYVGVRAKRAPDAARENAVWSAVIDFARRERG
jgi:hypothetical protein